MIHNYNPERTVIVLAELLAAILEEVEDEKLTAQVLDIINEAIDG